MAMPATLGDDGQGNNAEAARDDSMPARLPRSDDVGDTINVVTSPRAATDKGPPDTSPDPGSRGSTPRLPRKRAAPLQLVPNRHHHRSRLHSISSDDSGSVEPRHGEADDDGHRDVAVTDEEEEDDGGSGSGSGGLRPSPGPGPNHDNDNDNDDNDVQRPKQHYGVLAVSTRDERASLPQRDTICLCTPAPKVPRPRNAFILFRQHYQAQVVAQNAGLSNPEISKIIGTMWKEQPDDVKDSWKNLAEEEKIRHRHQYPDYRYQPRRGGRGGGSASGASATGASDGGGDGGRDGGDGEGQDPNRCPKCGGRYIATPRTPATPRFVSSTSRRGRGSSSSSTAATGRPPSSASSQGPTALPPLPTPLSVVGPAGSAPAYQQQQQQQQQQRQQHAALLSASQQRDAGRRPLPHHGRHSSALHATNQNSGYYSDADPKRGARRHESMPAARDDRAMSPPPPPPPPPQHSYAPMRTALRYASPAAPAPTAPTVHQAQPPPGAYHQGYHHYHGGSLPPTPGTAPLPAQYAGGRPSPQTPWTSSFPSEPLPGPPPSARHAIDGRGYPSTSYGGHQPGSSRGYLEPQQHPYPQPPPPHQQQQHPHHQHQLALRHSSAAVAPDRSARLPPPSNSAYGLYPPAGRSSSGSTGTNHAHGHSHSGNGSRTTSDSGATPPAQPQSPPYADASLKLPPLQTHVLAAEAGAQTADTAADGAGGGSSSGSHMAAEPLSKNSSATLFPPSAATAAAAAAAAAGKNGPEREPAISAVSAASSTISSHLRDMHAFAAPGPSGAVDSQASGVRAMVMSVPYLSKLLVLRRISPPQSLTMVHPSPGAPRRRGPIISIEGHNAALIAAIGRVVQTALAQSGECAVRTWCPRETLGEGRSSSDSGDKDTDDADDAKEDVDTGVVATDSHMDADVRRDSRDSAADTGDGEQEDDFLRPGRELVKNRTDSGIGSSYGGRDGDDGGDGDSHAGVSGAPSPGSDGTTVAATQTVKAAVARIAEAAPFSGNPMLAYHQFILSWHAKAQEMLKHVTATGGAAAAAAAAKRDERARPSDDKDASARRSSSSSNSSSSNRHHKPPGTGAAASATIVGVTAPPSPASFSHSPVPPPPSAEDMDVDVSAAASAADDRLVPVALVTGGYSLALSDQFAMTVPIDDAFSPISHWEWMATLWRGIAGPDLVVYGDAKPPAAGQTDTPVNTRAQEGVIVVHAPPADEKDKLADGGSWPLDKRTERRLAFEVMEWVRSNFGV